MGGYNNNYPYGGNSGMGSNMYGGFENMGGYGNGYGLTTGSYSRY
jgi:hypothetical protein